MKAFDRLHAILDPRGWTHGDDGVGYLTPPSGS